MTYTIAVRTVKNSWWWTEKLSETCRVLFQKWIWEISASSWFYYKNFRRIFHQKKARDSNLSPTLLSIDIDDILRTLKNRIHPRIRKNNTFVRIFLSADNQFFYKSEHDFQTPIYKMRHIAKNYNFQISTKNSKTMAFRWKFSTRTKICTIQLTDWTSITFHSPRLWRHVVWTCM